MTDDQAAKRGEQLTRIDQQLTQLLQQKQQLQSQLSELGHASEELARTDKAYKVIGNIMVAHDKDQLLKEITEKKELIDVRIKAVERQEDLLRKEAESVRDEVFK